MQNYSDLVEVQITKDVKQAVMPVQNQMSLWYTLATLDDKLEYFKKVSLTSWYTIRVNICLLEGCEKDLTRSYII